MDLNKEILALRDATTNLKTLILEFEKSATDLIKAAELAGKEEVYADAIAYQRAAHVAYDILNIEPDTTDHLFDQQRPAASAIRTGWIRWLVRASDDDLLRFHANITESLDEDSDDLPNMTPSD